MNTFGGLGFGAGVSVPMPRAREVASPGVDLVFESSLDVPGIGIGGGVGKSKLDLRLEGGLSAAWAFPFSQYCASTPERSCENCSCLK